jgi:tetratricopeptide (TPR) repeat protein
MVTQMTGVLAIQEATQRAIQREAEIRALGESARLAASQNANQLARDFLNANYIYDDGFYTIVESKSREIGYHKAFSDPSSLDPEVTIIEGLVDAVVRGDDRSAIALWQGKVLANSLIDKNLGMKRRTNYYIGLSHLKLGDYDDALKSFDEARNGDQVNGSYRLARLEALVRKNRDTRMEDKTQREVATEFANLYSAFSADTLAITDMPRHVFRSELTYWYGQFLIHAIGDPESMQQADDMLRREYEKPEQRSSRLDGVRFALNKARKTLSVDLFDGYIDQCSIEEQLGSPTENFSISMRKARYYGYRAVLKDREGNAEGMKSDVAALKLLIASLHQTLNRLRRIYRDARIYSPVTRKHEALETIRMQLETLGDTARYNPNPAGETDDKGHYLN